jgi:hypothetical protein
MKVTAETPKNMQIEVREKDGATCDSKFIKEPPNFLQIGGDRIITQAKVLKTTM